MTKLRSLLLTTVLLGTSLGAVSAQAQNYAPPGPPPGPGYGHPGPGPGGPHWRHWHEGDRYDGPRYVVRHWHRYHLAPPPPGFFWVQVNHQYLLLGGDGRIARIWGP
jgi:hypothetical protein